VQDLFLQPELVDPRRLLSSAGHELEREVPWLFVRETPEGKRAFAQPGCAEAACAYYSTIGLILPSSHRMQVTVPSVAFAGEHDNIAPRMYEKARHCFTSSYEVVIVPGGHFMHREHPEPFINGLVQTLQDKGRRT